jgi:uncharacterized protein YbcI
MVRLMRRISGRGPERARTTISRDHVLVMFRETLADGERNLIEAGDTEEVEALRSADQRLLRNDATKLIEDTPQVVFILDPAEEPATPVPQEAEHAAA